MPVVTSRGAAIIGWGKCMPPATLTNADMATFLDTSDEWITTRTGIRERRLSHVPLGELIHVAVARALACAGMDGKKVELIVAGTTSYDDQVPNVASGIQRRIGAEGCAAMDVNTACTSFLYGLSTATAMIRTGIVRNALVIGAEFISPFMDWTDRNVAVLFGDGAAAVVLLPGEPGVPGADIVDVEQLTIPQYADDLQVHAGDRGMRIRLSPAMPDVVSAAVGEPAKQLLGRNGIGWDEVAWWALHPGGRRILDRVEEALGLPEASVAESRAAMRAFGNTAAPAVLGVLERLTRTAPLHPGEHGVALAFGPGATIWAMLLRGA